MTLKLQPVPYSERMGARLRIWNEHGEAVAMLEVKVLRQGQSTVKEVGERVVTGLVELQDQLASANEALAEKRKLARQLDLALHGPEGAAQQASLCDLVDPAQNLRDQYKQACDRLFDMLLGDDWEAFFQAEAFLKQYQPDLYARIGLSMQTAMKGV